jgi:hypothetical protein
MVIEVFGIVVLHAVVSISDVYFVETITAISFMLFQM